MNLTQTTPTRFSKHTKVGGGASVDRQACCSECAKKFYSSRRLPDCGHMVCGQPSPSHCAFNVLSPERRRCPVLSCLMTMNATICVEDLEVPNLDGTENFLSKEYKKILKNRLNQPSNGKKNLIAKYCASPIKRQVKRFFQIFDPLSVQRVSC